MERYTCGAQGLVLQYICFLQSVIYRFNKFHSKSIQFVWKLSGPRIANSFQMKNKLYISGLKTYHEVTIIKICYIDILVDKLISGMK